MTARPTGVIRKPRVDRSIGSCVTRQALAQIVDDGKRASEVIHRIRGLIRKERPRKDGVEINAVILEVIALTRGELVKSGISLETKLAESLPLIQGDRVQLQQVILNLGHERGRSDERWRIARVAGRHELRWIELHTGRHSGFRTGAETGEL